MKKILIITYYWPPSGGAGVQRWVKFVKYLNSTGIKPYVLTVHPDSATYPQIDHTIKEDIPEETEVYYAKSFELYSLYKKLSSSKEIPYGGFANTKKSNIKEKTLRFIRGNFIFPDPRVGWNRSAFKMAKKIILQHQIDTVITTSPPHSTQLIGIKLKRELKIKWVADLRDPWTDIYYFKEMFPTLPAIKIHQYFERKVLRESDKIITISKSFKRLFATKTESIEEKISVIENGFDTDDFAGMERKTDPIKFYISYVGTLSDEYDLTGFSDALTLLPKEIHNNLKIRFTNKIPPNTIDQFKDKKVDDLIEITGYMPHKKAIELMFSSDLLLLVIPRTKNNEGILTGKLFEYLAVGKPILLIGPELGDAAQIVMETDSGVVCKYDDHKKIAGEIIKFAEQKYSHPSVEIPHFNQKRVLHFSRKELTNKLSALLHSL